MNHQTQHTEAPLIKGIENATPQQYPNKLAVIIKDKRITLQQVQKGIFTKDGKLVREGTGISYPVLIDFKKGGRNNFEDRTIRQIAEFLDVTKEQLMGAYESPKMEIKSEDKIDVRKSKKKPAVKKSKRASKRKK